MDHSKRRIHEDRDVRVCAGVAGLALFTGIAADRLADRPAGVGLDAALVALSGRVRVREGSVRTAEEIITELWNEVFAPAPQGESGKASAPAGATH